MTSHPYLIRLTGRLADGLTRLPEARRRRHCVYLRSAQNPDGGFPGREGDSDLYYTGFALRSLAVLGDLTPEVCERAAGFLRASLQRHAGVVDFFSLLYACVLVEIFGGQKVLDGAAPDWRDRVAATLEALRTADGGYAKAAGGPAGSTYHSFLVALCYQLLGREVPSGDALAAFVLSRRRDDGGFVEIGPMKRSGTNPTAAAVGALQIVAPRALDEVPGLRQGLIDFLAEMTSDEGGLRANGRVPLADLLSTFTGAWTLDELGAGDRLDPYEVRAYATGTERGQGGFHGGLWDTGHDVEYTFYGLGVLGLFAE
jgi:geranylgeranyl transferase type-2 subunit beta